MSDGFVVAGGHRLEVASLAGEMPTLVFLHEGLGSVSAWRELPAELARATGRAALVYSRAGYGRSEPIVPPRPLDYMQHEGSVVLPALLAATGIDDAILVGHSDGGSIALVCAATRPGLVRALILEAPHVFCEDVSVRSIAAARDAYTQGDLRARLSKHHADVDGAFWGWNRAWLDPGFRRWNLEQYLPAVEVPTLLIQGADDPYGTLAQIDAIERGVRGPVERFIVPACGHAPHRDHPAEVLKRMREFVARFPGRLDG